MGKMFQALVEEYRIRMEKCVGTALVSGDHLTNARAAYQDLAERASQADAAVQVLNAVIPAGVCSRCGTSRRCIPVDRREGGRDVLLCTSCLREERAALREQLEEHKRQERKLKEELECLSGILKKHEASRDKLSAKLAAVPDTDPSGFDA